MKEIIVEGQFQKSKILIDEPMANFPQYIDSKKVIILMDKNVRKHYEQYFQGYPIIEIGTGERIKNMDTIQSIIEQLIVLGVDRSSFLLGVGGGIVCDIVGFVASIYMRGMRFGFISTTLLSQVDASVGGKNGVNFSNYKNIIGVFNQPEFVICDMKTLQTLPKDELTNGYAEIVKHCLIADKHMFEKLETNWKQALELEPHFIKELITHSIITKAHIVNKDEKEKGERRKLNFGHTYAHAIERISGLGHGKAVSIGMVVAAKLSLARQLISVEDLKRIESLLKKLNLPITSPISNEDAFGNFSKDKKKEDNSVHYILLERIGKTKIEKISIDKLQEELNDLC